MIEQYRKDFNLLPSDIIISTITLHCKILTRLNIQNIMTSWRNTDNMIICINKKKNKNLKKNSKFYNQVPINITINDKKKPISIKLFTNGSIHMTGCKNIDNAISALKILFDELNYLNTLNKCYLDLEQLNVDNINEIKIAMINSNFYIGFEIDREKLYQILKNDKINCNYDPLIYAGVIIRHEYLDKLTTIPVFEKGSIIITGAKEYNQIINAYNFINKYLLSNYDNIKKFNINVSTILHSI